jgi:hypothetical protein
VLDKGLRDHPRAHVAALQAGGEIARLVDIHLDLEARLFRPGSAENN